MKSLYTFIIIILNKDKLPHTWLLLVCDNIYVVENEFKEHIKMKYLRFKTLIMCNDLRNCSQDKENIYRDI